MNRQEYNSATGNGYIKLTGESLYIDKDYLSELIAKEVIENGADLLIDKSVEVIHDLKEESSFSLCVQGHCDRNGWTTLDIDYITLCADFKEYKLTWGSLFIDQVIAKIDELEND